MRALRNTPQPPTVPMDGRLPNRFGNSSAPVFSLHVREVCGLSLTDAVRVFEQVLMRTALAPLFHQPSAILALRHGFKRGPLPRPADNAFQSCPATLTPAGKHPLTRGQRNLSSGGGFP